MKVDSFRMANGKIELHRHPPIPREKGRGRATPFTRRPARNPSRCRDGHQTGHPVCQTGNGGRSMKTLQGMMLMIRQDALADEVALGTFHGFKDVNHLLGGVNHVLLHCGALAARSLACPAALFFLIFFHDDNSIMKNNSYLCSTKPEVGRVSPPIGTLKDDSQNCYLYFPNPKENRELHRASGFCSSLTLVSGLNQCQPLSIDNTKVRKIFELYKCFSKFVCAFSNFLPKNLE